MEEKTMELIQSEQQKNEKKKNGKDHLRDLQNIRILTFTSEFPGEERKE